MNKMMMIGAACAAFAMMAGCGTPGKMRDIQLKGMYVNGYSEMLAIGSGRLTSIPGEREALAAHYEEDTAWLSPNIKTHKLDLFLVGTNTVDSSAEIVSSICKAFAEVAPSIAQTNAEVAKAGGTSPLDVVKGGGEVRKAVQMAKVAANATQTAKVAESATQTGDGSANLVDACAKAYASIQTAGATTAPGSVAEKIAKHFKSKGGNAAKSTVTANKANKTVTVTDGTTSIVCDEAGNCTDCVGDACSDIMPVNICTGEPLKN